MDFSEMFFGALTLIGGLALFLYGMHVMGEGLTSISGGRLERILERLTDNPIKAVLLGAGVTAVIQSSSATTVTVVGFVNSGIMKLGQAVGVIMGANVGTTVTSWLLSLTGLESSNFFLRLLKPSSFTPVMAMVGIILIMGAKTEKRKDIGGILAGFAVLMFGMEAMSDAVKPLADVPEFTGILTMFSNPFLGMLAGAVLTAVVQSSSASVGILQVLCATGKVSYSIAFPIIMGQNIGTCVTAMLSSVGANKNARRAALVHLSFNVIGSGVWLAVFWLVQAVLQPAFLDMPTSLFGIAAAHSAFNILCTVLMLPLSGLLERLVTRLVPDDARREAQVELDERLFTTPSIALEQCRGVAADMAHMAVSALKDSLALLDRYSAELAASIREKEEKTDHYEDALGTYLVKLSTKQISAGDHAEAAKLLKMIGDLERISDHAVNLVESAEEMREKKLRFTPAASRELADLSRAVSELLDLTLSAFLDNDLEHAAMVEPLTQVVSRLKEQLRTSHILRLQQGECTIDAGFVWSDLLTDLDRTSGHCSNIAGCVIDIAQHNINLHASLRELRSDSGEYRRQFQAFANKYALDG